MDLAAVADLVASGALGISARREIFGLRPFLELPANVTP
jgi:hypothetical protein